VGRFEMQVRLHPGILRCWNFGAMTIDTLVLRLPRGAHATISALRRETWTLWVVSELKPHREVARVSTFSPITRSGGERWPGQWSRAHGVVTN
jgi:hypothetical protein